MTTKRTVLYIETLPNAQGFSYLTKETNVDTKTKKRNVTYYAEYVYEGDVRAKLFIPDPTHVLVSTNHYLDLTKGSK